MNPRYCLSVREIVPRRSSSKQNRSQRKLELKAIAGAHKSARPDFIEPCHPTLEDSPPGGEDWLHEAKLDGYRAQAHIADGICTIYTRNGLDWTARFQPVARALGSCPRECVLDGEMVALDDRGLPDFHFLQQGVADRLVFFGFDVLHLDGFDLRDAAMIDRRRALEDLARSINTPRFKLSEAFDADGQVVLSSIKQFGLEGIVSKKKDSRYRSGRQSSWRKVKFVRSDTYVVVGFTASKQFRPPRVDGIYLARLENDRLLYSGKAETGFSDKSAIDLYQRLAPLVRKQSPLSVTVRKPKALWVEPRVLVEIEFTGLTSDGHLRHPSFKGIRIELD